MGDHGAMGPWGHDETMSAGRMGLRFSHELGNLGRKFKVHTDGSPQLWLTFPMMSLQGQTLGESCRQCFEEFVFQGC